MNAPLFKWILLAGLLIGGGLPGLAQTAILDRTVTLEAREISLTEALAKLSEAGNFFLAYNPGFLPDHHLVSLPSNPGTVADALDAILADTRLSYLVWEDHVLLQRTSTNQPTPATCQRPLIRLSGQVKNLQTREPLAGVRIEGTGLPVSPQTDMQGWFSFSLPVPSKDSLHFTFHFPGFLPATMALRPEQSQELGILSLVPILVEELPSRLIEARQIQVRNPMDEVVWVRVLVNTPELARPLKPEHLLAGFGQVSLIPPLGSNWRECGNRRNHFSLNVLAGYSGELQGLEIGGLLNADRHSMSGVQIGGVANVVGGPASGVQISGATNVNLSTMSGIQLAGVLNTATDLEAGLQAAGVANLLKRSMNGAQIAGAINLSPGNLHGAQIAGLSSLNWGEVKGVQISGLFNLAKEFHGVQIAPINVARSGHGLQLGFVNAGNEMSGVPIGFLNLINHGYQSIAVGADEWWPVNAMLRLGVPGLYNLFGVGWRAWDDQDLWGFSYGIGSLLTPGAEKYRLKLEGLATGLLPIIDAGQRLQVRLLAERTWNSGAFLEIGPTISWFRANDNLDPAMGEWPLPRAIWNQYDGTALRHRIWLGVSVSFGWRREKKNEKNFRGE